MRLSKEFRDQFIQHEMRTHGRKNGFVTTGQEARLLHWLPLIGLPKEKTLADANIPAGSPVVMEIGFGNGDFLVHLAESHPEWTLIGVEIYLPGVAKAVGRLEDAGVIERTRITQLPAQYVLEHQVAAEQLDGLFVNHPDPWPKARHHKRRIIQKDFAALMVSRLKPGGFIKLASDKPDLAEWMRDILDVTPGLKNVAGVGGYIDRDADRPETKFEQRGLRAGRVSQFLHYVKE
ncbi:tRNA (guanosine(46)-N7)-methyltransferase TrmB [Mariprofundus ferrooxydans]|uniref:tRNA (guanosine(46)-N7)-methyltransferase TrmB n=1 Tax=Mariprofundus ferrooxydans TaxID=314344 RepID=UPI0014315795|nr:tRNA (guanosine(46)-N7)-methyltransferase TrmB [Mariprofundus ferrooxydans]